MARFLLLRLEAPLAAFGDVSVDAIGPVSDLPSASMITGLLANALGWRREDRAALQRLQDRLVHAARLDRVTGRFTEFQTAELLQNEKGWTSRGRVFEREKSPSYSTGPDGRKVLTNPRHRDHDADLSAVVALTLEPAAEAPDLDALAAALAEPFRPLFVGRKPCLPTAPILAGIVEAADLLAALKISPLARPRDRNVERDILVELPIEVEAPRGFRRLHRCDRRDWIAGVHAGDSLRWSGRLPASAFASTVDGSNSLATEGGGS